MFSGIRKSLAGSLAREYFPLVSFERYHHNLHKRVILTQIECSKLNNQKEVRRSFGADSGHNILNLNRSNFSSKSLAVEIERQHITNDIYDNSELIFLQNMGEDIKTLEALEANAFEETFHRIKNDIIHSRPEQELNQVFDWFQKVIDYNVPHGKRNRGLALVMSYRMLAPKESQTAQTLEISRILGWCVEILQAYFLVADDIMDQSVTRRGNPCWYRKEGVNLIAINDSLLLESSMYLLLKKHLSGHPLYSMIVDLFLETNRHTVYGQTLDLLSSPPDCKPDLTKFTMTRYSAIVKYKTAFYSFSLPVRIAMYLAGIEDEEAHRTAEIILLKMGHFFQVQDDYLDCFGDPLKTGKVGTDIEEGKCCWPFVVALELVSTEQRKTLAENYGRNDVECVKKVKKVYVELEIGELYKKYENDSFDELQALIAKMGSTSKLPPTIFYGFLSKIYQRDK